MARTAMLEHDEALAQGLLDIGRAAGASGVSVKMIRHYEAIGLLPKVARTYANYRVYSEADVHVLRFIKRARTLGFPIEDIRELVGLWRSPTRSAAAVKKVAGRHIADLREKLAGLQAMLATLEHLSANCHGDARPDCPILDDLAAPHDEAHCHPANASREPPVARRRSGAARS